MGNVSPDIEEMVYGLHVIGEIKYADPPPDDAEVQDRDYPDEVFWTLKSGRKSPFYVGGRDFTSFSRNFPVAVEEQRRTRDLVVASFSELLDQQQSEYNHLVGIPEAMTCLAGLVAQFRGDSVLWMRVGEKKYGSHKSVQGHYSPDDKVTALDNVVTDGASKIEMIEPLVDAELRIARFDVLIDREEGGREALESAGYPFAAVVGMGAVTAILADSGRITAQQQEWTSTYYEKLRNQGIIT
ncbi:hypothetical protein HYS84_01415 [Candidatus Saccharibacteria bacterium]|nr:hypothetical protein [Candidatus Saccharibacteria bacterium]